MNRVQRANRRRRSAGVYAPALIHGAAVPGRRIRGKFFGTFGFTPLAEGKHLAFQRGGWVRNGNVQTTLALGLETLPAATSTLSAGVARGATSLPIVAASIPTGFYWLGSRTIVNSVAIPRQAGGELVEVTASSANTATLSRPLVRGHLSGAALSAVPVSRNVRISGMRAFGVRDVTENHIYVGTALGLTVENCQLNGSQVQSVYCIRSSDVTIQNIRIANTPVGVSGQGYAVGPAQSVRLNISNIAASNSRHCVSLTGSCAEATVQDISSADDCSFVYDDHDGCEWITLRRASAPVRVATGAQGAGIQLGNSEWTWEGADYTIEDCTADFIELRHRRIRHTFNQCQTRFMNVLAGSHTSNGFTQRFQQITYQNGVLAGRDTDSTLQVGPSGGGSLIEIDRLLFAANTFNAGNVARHLVTVSPTQGTWTNYSLRIEGGTIGGISPNTTGARIVRQTGSATATAEFRLEVTGTAITPVDNSGGTSTPLFGRISTVAGSSMTAALATSATFRGAALASGNVGGTGVTHSSVVTV